MIQSQICRKMSSKLAICSDEADRGMCEKVIRQKTQGNKLNSSYLEITANLAGHDLDRKGAAGVVPAVLVVDLVGLVESLAGKGALEEGSAHFKDVAGLEGGAEERRGASDKSDSALVWCCI